MIYTRCMYIIVVVA